MLVEFIVLMGDGERWPSHKKCTTGDAQENSFGIMQ